VSNLIASRARLDLFTSGVGITVSGPMVTWYPPIQRKESIMFQTRSAGIAENNEEFDDIVGNRDSKTTNLDQQQLNVGLTGAANCSN